MCEAAVISVIRAQEEATSTGNARANVEVLSTDAVVFDLPPQLVYQGNQARDIEALEAWFATWRDGVTVHLADPHIIVDGDLAVAFGLSRMTGIKTDGTKVDSWSRRTVVLQRSVGVWKIVQEHASFPMAMDGSGRAVTDLLA